MVPRRSNNRIPTTARTTELKGKHFDVQAVLTKNLQKRIAIAEEKLESEKRERNKDTWCDFFNEFALILWDGSGFWGMKYSKLNRIRGIPVTWCTRCLDAEFIIQNLIVTVVSIYVLIA